MKEIDDNIKAKFITGQCTDEELAAVAQWMKQSSGNADELLHMEHLYQEAQAAAMPQRETEKALARLHTRMEQPGTGTSADGTGWQDDAQSFSHNTLRMWHRWAAAIAIVVVVCAGIYGWHSYTGRQQSVEYIVAKASATTPRQLTLPDGTRVWLNRGAELRYPKEFCDTLRQTMLVGEGYFEVTKDKARPFVVDSRDMNVRVLGTVFNFNTRTAGNTAEVSLIEGSVMVNSHRSAGQVVLMPGQKAQLSPSGHLTVSNVDTRIDAVWHNELIPFSGCNVRQIANTLEQLYNVKIVVDANVNRNDTYSGQIMWKQDIDTVLTLLQNTLPISFAHRGDKVYITPQE